MWITSFSALGIMKYYIESTKTTSGTRKIPMTEEVKELCQRIVANRNKPKRESIIDGYGGFLFFDKEGKPMEGVTITMYGTSSSTKTDATGHFELRTPKDASLQISRGEKVLFRTKVAKDIKIVLDK